MNPSELLRSEFRLFSKFLLFDGLNFLFPESSKKVPLDRVTSFSYIEYPPVFEINFSKIEGELVLKINIVAVDIICFENEVPISSSLGIKGIERQVEAINFYHKQIEHIENLCFSLRQKHLRGIANFEPVLKSEIFKFMYNFELLKSLGSTKLKKQGVWDEGAFSYNIYIFRILINAITLNERNVSDTGLNDLEKISTMTGIEFENFLIRKLNEIGVTDIQNTPASGDQGADVIFKYQGKKVVIQAKRYVGKVGNKAIQEVFAARTFYSCSAAWVITNSSFTDSAIKLAGKLKVVLIDGRKLSSLKYLLEAL